MSPPELAFLPAWELADAIRRRQVSPVEVLDETLARMASLAPQLNCYITTMEDQARHQARAMEELLMAGVHLGELHGVPMSVKDSLSTASVRTTVGSPLLARYVPTKNATVVERLQAAGAVLIAKDNMYDMAYGGPNPLFGPTRNPWDLGRTCGGSSSGSASAVAGGISFAALGTDGGGSIRMPAAFCGIVGLKPTYGLVPGEGEIPCPCTLASIGPMTRTVRDAALVLRAIADEPMSDDELSALDRGVRGLRIAVPAAQASQALDAEVAAAVEEACRVLEREGATVQQVELPDFTTFRAIMWVVTGAEFAGCLRPLLRRSAPELHPWTRVLLERSEFVPATEYIHAQRVRARLAADVRAALAGFDALALPAVPIPAFPIDKPPFVEVEGVREEPLSMSVRYTAAFNCTGHPAVTVPCGFTSAGLPIGLQVVGRSFDEATVLRVAHTYERATGWHEERPPGARQAHAAA